MSASEVWAVIPNHPGYEASDLGRIRSTDRTVMIARSRWGGAYLRPVKGQVLTPSSQGNYLHVALARRTRLIHLLVLETFVGECPVGMEARHGNGNALDNRLSNLSWGTHSENQFDQVRHGTHPNARKATCPAEHRLVEPNLDPYERGKGRRKCRSCKHAQQHCRRHPDADVHAVADAKYAEIMKVVDAA